MNGKIPTPIPPYNKCAVCRVGEINLKIDIAHLGEVKVTTVTCSICGAIQLFKRRND